MAVNYKLVQKRNPVKPEDPKSGMQSLKAQRRKPASR